MDPITGGEQALNAGLTAAGKIADAIKERNEQVNTVDQRSNAEAAQIQADKDKVRKDIAENNQDALDKDMSP